MNLVFNSNTPQQIIYNNNNVARVVFNGNDVWYQKIQYTADETTFPMTLTKTLPYNAIDYNIYGNTVRTGTPSKENPAQITHVGDLITDINDTHYGEYAIPITISDSNNQISTVNIYLDEPLRAISTGSDYIDFVNQKVVRNIKEIVFKGNENWTKTSGSGGRPAYYRYNVGSDNRPGTQSSNTQLSNYFAYGAPTTSNTATGFSVYVSGGTTSYARLRDDDLTTADLINEFMEEKYNDGEPVVLAYLLATSQESSVTLPDILLVKGTTILNFGTTLLPTRAMIQYYGSKY